MKTACFSLLGAGLIVLLAGCASTPIAVSPVGPEPTSSSALTPKGYLKVFSDTETHIIGDNAYYYPHTGYTILDGSDRLLGYVPNHLGNMDETPSIVTIPVGHYKIKAESASYGRVTVPVIVAQGRSTVVHLDGYWRPSSNAATNAMVFFPDGEAVGWK
jgi:hypothetical protein